MDELNIVVPLALTENTKLIVESCMKKDGLNKKHSRSIKLPDFKIPNQGGLTPRGNKYWNSIVTIEIIWYYFKKCLLELKNRNCNMDDFVYKYIPNFVPRDITGNDLLKITNYSIEEMLDIQKKEPKEMNKLEAFINKCFSELKISEEHCNSSILYKDASIPDENEELYGFNPKYSKRLYMNLSPNSEMSYMFGLIFIKKCIDYGISFDMKLFGSFSHNPDDLDGTIFYSKNVYFGEHIRILREIIRDYPEYKPYIGSTISTSGHILEENGESYIGISHAGNCYYHTDGQTYNDTSDTMINALYTYSCCKIIKKYFPYFINKVDQETLSRVTFILNNELSIETLKELSTIEETIRKAVFEFRNFKKNENIDVDEMLNLYVQQYMSSMVSLVNFGDLEHQNIPMYEDRNFILLYGKKYS